MAFTFDTSTDRGKVRLLVGDKVEAYAIFDDDEIDAFLDIEGGVVKLAAAAAAEAIAASQAYIQKVQTIGDTKTDGAALAKAFRELAAAWRTQDAEQPAFDWAEWSVSPAAARAIVVNDALRQM